MNTEIKKIIYKISEVIQKKDYVEAMFATSLDQDNFVLINFIINSPGVVKELEDLVYNSDDNTIKYECHIFYHSKDDYNIYDYDNLTNRQINFLELLALSDIFIDKTGILLNIKRNINNKYKKL